LRALFIEYPEDPGSWLVDDEYLFGSDMLVAPLLENAPSRNVYLPPGKWIDYQSGKVYSAGWTRIETGDIPAVILVRDGAAIPHVKLAQSTAAMDWSNLDLVVYAAGSEIARAMVCLPSDLKLNTLTLARQGNRFRLIDDPLSGRVTWSIRQASSP
jgi:alpha-D-xyloside xylohydrolase